MKALVTGGQSKFGEALVQALSNKNNHVYVIPRWLLTHDHCATGPSTGMLNSYLSSTDKDEWDLMNTDKPRRPLGDDSYRTFDLVFFNHHYMPEEFDARSYYFNCVLCLDILKSIKLTKDCKIAWMVSSGIGAKDHPEYAPYFAFKSVNVHIMRYLAHKNSETYFGIDPGHLIEGHYETPAKQVVALLDKVESGNVYTLNGSVSGL